LLQLVDTTNLQHNPTCAGAGGKHAADKLGAGADNKEHDMLGAEAMVGNCVHSYVLGQAVDPASASAMFAVFLHVLACRSTTEMPWLHLPHSTSARLVAGTVQLQLAAQDPVVWHWVAASTRT
jgi:hypothetical protein